MCVLKYENLLKFHSQASQSLGNRSLRIRSALRADAASVRLVTSFPTIWANETPKAHFPRVSVYAKLTRAMLVY